MIVFLHRTLLQKNVAPRIEDQDMGGAVLQALAMNFLARELADDFIAVIYDIENFVLHAAL
jgi:hypothetical protein